MHVDKYRKTNRLYLVQTNISQNTIRFSLVNLAQKGYLEKVQLKGNKHAWIYKKEFELTKQQEELVLKAGMELLVVMDADTEKDVTDESERILIVAKEVKGINVVGFTIENVDGNRKNISLQDAIKLARGNKIRNASAKFDLLNSEYMIDIDGGINNIENSDRTKGLKLSLLGRLINVDGKCIGYRAQDDKGKVYKLSIAKVWDLAEQGSILGIKAKLSSNGRVLESTSDCELSKLPVFKG